MEATLILPISYLQNIAVKRLVFLSHNPTKQLSPLCTVQLSQDETKGSAETKCGRLSLALFALSTTFYADYILDLIRRLDQGATITHGKNFEKDIDFMVISNTVIERKMVYPETYSRSDFLTNFV